MPRLPATSYRHPREIGAPLEDFRREFSRVFGDFFGSALEPLARSGQQLWAPAIDVRETDGEIHVDLEAPGIKPEELDVTLAEDTLTIRGEKKHEREEEDENENYYVRERSYGSFQRRLPLPTSVDPDNVTSEFKDGVLSIKLPKSERTKPKKIEVKT